MGNGALSSCSKLEVFRLILWQDLKLIVSMYQVLRGHGYSLKCGTPNTHKVI